MQDSSVSNLIFMPDTDMKETTAWDVLLFLSQRVEEVDVSDASFACQVYKFWLWHPDDWDTVFKGMCCCLSNFAFLFGFQTPVGNQQTCMHMFFFVLFFLALFVLTCVL